MHIHRLSADEALASLKSSLAGLAQPDAARRLLEFGPNRVEELKREHLLLGFAREFTHFFALILWAGAALAFVAEHFDPGQGMASLGGGHRRGHFHQWHFFLLAGIQGGAGGGGTAPAAAADGEGAA